MDYNLHDVLRQHRAFSHYLFALAVAQENNTEIIGVTSIKDEIAKVESILKDLEVLIERLSKS